MQVNGQNNKIEYNTTVFVHPGSNMQEMNQWKENLIAILQQVPSEADALKPLIQLIVTAMAPHKIFMLKNGGNTNTCPEMYIDLLIIMADNNNVPFAELEPVLEIACLRHQRVCCSLHSACRVKESIQKGHIFYSMNCISENLVYDDKGLILPSTTPEALGNMKSQIKEKFTPGFEKAVSFYKSALHLHQNNSSPIVAFYLHQATEFTYRAILQSLNGFYKKTHVIRSLKTLARRCAPQLNAILPDNTRKESHLLDALETGYLNARYDNQYNADDNDLLILFERVKRVQEVAQDMVEQAIAGIPAEIA